MLKIQVMMFLVFFVTSCANLAPKENVVFSNLNNVENGNDILTFVMEVPKGSTNKYELRAATGNLFLDRHICPRVVYGTKNIIQKYPITYGIAPGYFNVDGDPLDVVVIGSDSKYQDLIKNPSYIKPQQVRIVGLYKMEECEELVCANGKGWIQDWKIIAVDLDDKLSKFIKDIDDVSSTLKDEISEYWSNYKGGRVIAGYGYSSKTRVDGFLNKKETLDFVKKNFTPVDAKTREKEVADCHEVYANRAKSKQVNQNIDKLFLKCLEQVHYEGFKPKHKDFDFLVRYSAYQYLLKLGETGVKMDNVYEKMAKRKAEGKAYYRYVSYDLPTPPGTGNPIFEWIKTVDQTIGCVDTNSKQHYEERPILDIVVK